MSWKTEFPDYDGEFHLLDGWQDNSWHNDTCPHIEKRGCDKETEVRFCIWQDYVAIEKREFNDCCKRFLFHVYVNDDLVFYYQSDDWNDIEQIVKGVSFPSKQWKKEWL